MFGVSDTITFADLIQVRISFEGIIYSLTSRGVAIKEMAGGSPTGKNGRKGTLFKCLVILALNH